MITIDPASRDSRDVYKLMIGGIVPRPIAFISTLSPDGRGNLAPFSFFNGVSSNPPCLMVAITRKNDGSKKDTTLNIEATRQFVVNTVSEEMAGPMNQCSGEYPYGVDEMKEVGLTPLPSVKVKPPRVKESPIHFECELHGTYEVGGAEMGAATIVVGRIVLVHVRAEALDEKGRVRLDAIKPLSRLGGLAYGKTTGVFELPRPKVGTQRF